MTEFYKKYRPTEFEDVEGQDEAVRTLKNYVDKKRVPHAILLIGPSGVGKTTLARILRHKLKCGDHDYQEKNASETRGIDFIRELKRGSTMAPISGRCRVWVVDECAGLTGDAQRAFLKLLEDTPKRAYFILATTDPHKLLPTIRTRCTEISVVSLNNKALNKTIFKVCTAEGINLDNEVSDKIVEVADGSARKALVLLDKVSNETETEEQLSIIRKSEGEVVGYALAKALLWEGRPSWKNIARIIKDCKEDPEQIRRLVLGCATTTLLRADKNCGKGHTVIDAFSENYFSSGKAGLAYSAYHAVKEINNG